MSIATAPQKFLSKVLSLAARIGADPSDGDELRLRKTVFVGLMVFGALPSEISIGAVLFAFGEPVVGAMLFVFALNWLLITIFFGLMPRHYRFFLWCAFSNGLLNSFVFSALLGTSLSVVGMLWTFLTALWALVADDPKYAWRWFAAYIVLLGIRVALQPYLRPSSLLPPTIDMIVAVMSMIGVTAITFFTLSYFADQKNLFQEKADHLLLNILPKEIAAILKNEDRLIADQFDGASILFADVVNFTPMSAQMSPTELVELLNEVFSHFDSLVEKYGLEKIKTIGDCYMAAAGVPRPRSDHAHTLARMALDIRDYVDQHEFRGKHLAFRIGINSGAVVAGVIGRKKFIYDLWGDAVNTASRMESQGAGGIIQITEATYDLVKNDFVCESRGVIDVKGKGAMKVWQVLDRVK